MIWIKRSPINPYTILFKRTCWLQSIYSLCIGHIIIWIFPRNVQHRQHNVPCLDRTAVMSLMIMIQPMYLYRKIKHIVPNHICEMPPWNRMRTVFGRSQVMYDILLHCILLSSQVSKVMWPPFPLQRLNAISARLSCHIHRFMGNEIAHPWQLQVRFGSIAVEFRPNWVL